MSESERAWLRTYVGRDKVLLITGEDVAGLGAAANIIRFRKCPGKDYNTAWQKGFDASTPDREHEFLERLTTGAEIRVVASPMIATSIARIDGKPHVFFTNFEGLHGRVNPVQTPQTGVEVTVSGVAKGRGFILPVFGDVQPLDGTAGGSGITYKLPAIEKGAVFWYEP